MFKYLFILLISFLFVWGCGKTPQKDPEISIEAFEAGPRLVKISLPDDTTVDELLSAGIELVVIEEKYVIARLDKSQAINVQSLSLSLESFPEEELVQRLIKVVMREKSDLQKLADTGIDIWEVKNDTLIAQAFDNYIREIRVQGYPVEILENNIQNILNKKSDLE